MKEIMETMITTISKTQKLSNRLQEGKMDKCELLLTTNKRDLK